MTKEQVQMLRDAGISETAIIDKILSESSTQKPDPGPEIPEKEQAKESEKPYEKTDPDPEADGDKTSEKEDKILAAIEKLTGAIYNHNVLSSGGEDAKTESADDIIGKALRNA